MTQIDKINWSYMAVKFIYLRCILYRGLVGNVARSVLHSFVCEHHYSNPMLMMKHHTWLLLYSIIRFQSVSLIIGTKVDIGSPEVIRGHFIEPFLGTFGITLVTLGAIRSTSV